MTYLGNLNNFRASTKHQRPAKCKPMPSATRTQRIHLLVLETDTPLPKIYKERGSFADIFGELFDKAGKALKPPVQVETSSYYVVGDEAEYPESLEGVDAILLTGSKFDAHGNDDWIHKLISFTRGLVLFFFSRSNSQMSGRTILKSNFREFVLAINFYRECWAVKSPRQRNGNCPSPQ